MDTHNDRIPGPLFGIGALVLLTFGASLLPASWFGIGPVQRKYITTDLSALSLDDVVRDADRNGSIGWRELVTESLDPSTLDELKNQKPDPETIEALNNPNNLTASFSKNLYAASAYFSKNPLQDPLAEQEVINQLLEKEAEKIVPQKYTLKEINIAKTESKESIKTYGNQVASILQRVISEKSIVDDFSSVQGYIETQDKTALEPITKDSEKVRSLVEELLKMPVPLSAATYHVMMLERVSLYRDTLYNLSQIEKDPVRSTLSIKQYPEIIVQTLRIHTQLANYFDSKNVIFTSKEPGYVFTVGYTLK